MDEWIRAIGQLMERFGGPLSFRFLLQPIMAISLAIRAGLRDAREGNPAFLWELAINPAQRGQLLRSMWKDIRRLFLLAFVIDAAYQLAVLKFFYPLQALVVSVTLAVVPYILLRGPVSRLYRRFHSET